MIVDVSQGTACVVGGREMGVSFSNILGQLCNMQDTRLSAQWMEVSDISYEKSYSSRVCRSILNARIAPGHSS
jgi:hypothetical protein